MKIILSALIMGLFSQLAVASNINPYVKGVDIYSWKDSAGEFWYSLVPGKNALEKWDDLKSAKMHATQLEANLKKLPQGTSVSWNNPVTVEQNKSISLTYPSPDKVIQIKKIAANKKLKLDLTGL